MKTIGLLGGMSWESTAVYYQAINEEFRRTLGGFHSAVIILYSVDFALIEKLQSVGDWNGVADIVVEAAHNIETAGADFLLICSNTIHVVAPEIERAVNIPLLHIADATAEALVKNGVNTVGLLGSSYTMEQEFYKGRLFEKYGIEVIIPNESDRMLINSIIYKELCQGIIQPESRQQFIRVIKSLAAAGAEAVIAGCTEISMLVKQCDSDLPLYDTPSLHVAEAVKWAL